MSAQGQGTLVTPQYLMTDGTTAAAEVMTLDELAAQGLSTQYILADGDSIEYVNATGSGQQIAYADGAMAVPVQGADGETVYLQGFDLDQLVGDGQEMVLVSADDAEALQMAGSGIEFMSSGQPWVSGVSGDQIQVFGDDSGYTQLLEFSGNQYQLAEIGDNELNEVINGPKEGTSSSSNFAAGSIIYRCPTCPAMYSNANAFTKHMREKHFVKVFTCRQCQDFFETLTQLFLHARRTHVDPRKPKKNPANYKFHCDQCTYMTNNAGTMEHHKRAHTGEKPYECDFCGKRFAQKANMKTHRNRHVHRERIFRCETCLKAFTSYDIYLAHLRTREHELREHFQMMSSSSLQLECLGCMQSFDSIYNLNKHTRSCRIVRTLQTKFRCIPCEAYIADVTALKAHIKAHEGTAVITCPVCGERGFPGFNQLNHHITRAHALKVTRRFVCRYCESTFEFKEEMNSHIDEMHSEERNARQSRGAVGRLKCRFRHCDFTTNSMILLDRHHDNHSKRAVEAERKRIIALEKAKTTQNSADARIADMATKKSITIIKADELFEMPQGEDEDLVEDSAQNHIPATEVEEATGNTAVSRRTKTSTAPSRPLSQFNRIDDVETVTSSSRGRQRKLPSWYKDYHTPDMYSKASSNIDGQQDIISEEEAEDIEKMMMTFPEGKHNQTEASNVEEWDIVVFDGAPKMETNEIHTDFS